MWVIAVSAAGYGAAYIADTIQERTLQRAGAHLRHLRGFTELTKADPATVPGDVLWEAAGLAEEFQTARTRALWLRDKAEPSPERDEELAQLADVIDQKRAAFTALLPHAELTWRGAGRELGFR